MKTSELHSNLKIPHCAVVEPNFSFPYISKARHAHTQSGDTRHVPSP